jgi:type IV fimbrial biogenesis protein FimT
MDKSRGFTLVELIVAISIIGILSTLALPSFRGMIAGVRVRSTAESFNHGLQFARSEAIKRNSRVSFKFFPSGANAGRWEVCASVSTSSSYTCPSADLLQIKTAAEASQNVVIAATPPGSTMTTFTGLGRQYTNAASALNNPDDTAEVTTVNFSATSTSKTYRVIIGPGGSSRLCDPSLPAGNVKACP